ncbi:MAG: pyrroline-5-carboxylate reductase [Tannerella sp.]|jgi:pyrroline-5-carboxylate reductase|nr:pyrroline-5-carboxylate reductase [Tannerella sp.]
MKLTIIGAGNIGGAIALGLSKSKIISEYDICCADRSTETLERLQAACDNITATTDNLQAVEDADIVVIAVKPWFVEDVINEIKNSLDYRKQTIVSIAAGVEFAQLCGFLRKDSDELPPLFRIIPNTAIEVRESVNFVSVYKASAEQTATIERIFKELGLTIIIEERLMRSGTALASCGIAYAFRYIRANIECAIELGLYPEQAKRIMMQTLKGAITLLDVNNSHPEAEIDRVTTPGGITIKGLNAMEEAGFTQSIIKGLKASV